MSGHIKSLAVWFTMLLTAAGLGGCAGYDVEFKGGLFDLAGLSSIGKRKPEPRMKKRTGLVVPPTTASLPTPGSGAAQSAPPAVAANGQSWPVDPEQSRAERTAAIRRQHEEFCARARQRRDSKIDTTMPSGPLGSCEESVLRNITGKRVTESPAQPQPQ